MDYCFDGMRIDEKQQTAGEILNHDAALISFMTHQREPVPGR